MLEQIIYSIVLILATIGLLVIKTWLRKGHSLWKKQRKAEEGEVVATIKSTKQEWKQ